ncbi:MAG: polysaccharide deacetylase family protein [Sphingobacteriaceae bacterium]
MYLFKIPGLLKVLHSGSIWNKNRFERCIYLTFDDGPIPIVTTFVLKTLAEYNAQATFFCIGDNVHKYPDIFQQVKAAGHSIGNHTYNHLKGWNTPDTIYQENFIKCAEIVPSNLFRPPYGRARRSQIKNLKKAYPKLQIIMWDVLSGDFDQQLKPEKCLNKVLQHTQNGSIVVFHDSLKAFDRLKYVLPKALSCWTDKGYTFRALL